MKAWSTIKHRLSISQKLTVIIYFLKTICSNIIIRLQDNIKLTLFAPFRELQLFLLGTRSDLLQKPPLSCRISTQIEKSIDDPFDSSKNLAFFRVKEQPCGERKELPLWIFQRFEVESHLGFSNSLICCVWICCDLI